MRLGLIETLFEMMYEQKRTIGHDETRWPHRIMGGRKIVGVEEKGDGISLRLQQALSGDVSLAAEGLVESDSETLDGADDEEELVVDLIVAATGYRRTAHIDMLKDAWELLPEAQDGAVARADRWSIETESGAKRVMEVGRDYKVKFSQGAVASESGIWLQGCCEGTHGVSPQPPDSCAIGSSCFVVTDILPAERHPFVGSVNACWRNGRGHLRKADKAEPECVSSVWMGNNGLEKALQRTGEVARIVVLLYIDFLYR